MVLPPTRLRSKNCSQVTTHGKVGFHVPSVDPSSAESFAMYPRGLRNVPPMKTLSPAGAMRVTAPLVAAANDESSVPLGVSLAIFDRPTPLTRSNSPPR